MKKLYLAMLVGIGTPGAHLHSMYAFEPLELYKDLLKTLPTEPNTRLRAMVIASSKYSDSVIKLIISDINETLDQGGQFDLRGIAKSTVFELVKCAILLNNLKTVEAILKAGRRISPEYNKTILSGEANNNLMGFSLLGHSFNKLECQNGKSMFHLLVFFGADINRDRGGNGFTLLHKAVKENRGSLVEFLLDAGARHDIKNKSGKTPVDLFHRMLSVPESQYPNSKQAIKIATLLKKYQKERILHPIPSLVDQCVAIVTRHGIDLKSTGFELETKHAGVRAGRFMLATAQTKEAAAAGSEVE